MKHINFYSEKSGYGVTSSALLVSVALSKIAKTLLVTDDKDDVIAQAGLPSSEEQVVSISDTLSVTEFTTSGEYPVDGEIDYLVTECDHPLDGADNVCVTDNHYLSLRRTVSKHGGTPMVLCVLDEGSALSENDVKSVFRSKHFFTIPRTVKVGRAFDAGLLDRAVAHSHAQILTSQMLVAMSQEALVK